MSASIKISQALQGVLVGLETHLKEIAGEKVGIVLLTTTINDKTSIDANYGTNLELKDALPLLEKFAELQRQRMEPVPHHKKH